MCNFAIPIVHLFVQSVNVSVSIFAAHLQESVWRFLASSIALLSQGIIAFNSPCKGLPYCLDLSRLIIFSSRLNIHNHANVESSN
jgi:hypothetical protein